MNGRRVSLLYLVPALGLLSFALVIPIIWSIGLSVTDFNLWAPGAPAFIGLRNYTRLISDPEFLQTLKVTFVFVILAVSGHFVLGFLFANLVRIPGIKGKRLISTAMLIPWLTPGLASAFVWRSVLNVDYGWLNRILAVVGVREVHWLFDHAFLSVLVANWSRGMAVAFLLLSAGLASIPQDVFDSAKTDGASVWQTLIHIKIPMIKYSILVVLLLNTFGTFKAFDLIYPLTGGGPFGQTKVFAIYLYQQAFQGMALGFAGAASFVIMVVVFVLGVVYIRSIRIEEA